MAKTGRLTGPSHAAGPVPRQVHYLPDTDVELLGSGSDVYVRGGMSVDGDVAMPGRLVDFGGFAIEDVGWPATAFHSSATMLTTNGFPRYSLPEDVDTSVFLGGFNFPEWYTPGGTDLHFAWVNEGAGAQNALWAWSLRQVNPFGSAISASTIIASGFGPFATLAQGVVNVTILDLDVQLAAHNALAGYILGLEIARWGTGDTLQNAVGFVAAGFVRKDAA